MNGFLYKLMLVIILVRCTRHSIPQNAKALCFGMRKYVTRRFVSLFNSCKMMMTTTETMISCLQMSSLKSPITIKISLWSNCQLFSVSAR